MTNYISSIILLCICMLCALSTTHARVQIPFWHSQDVTADTIQALADGFNASQDSYAIVPEFVGNYREASIKLVTSLANNTGPILFDAELTVFPRLIEEGTLTPLDSVVATLPSELTRDLYPNMWAYGEVDSHRYGLPWNMSTPVLFYNATAFQQRGVGAPVTWDDFELAADRLTTRKTRGYISVSVPYVFEALVSTRGGTVVTSNGRPNFNSPEALEAMQMLERMSRSRHTSNRSLAETDVAVIDFVRTKGMMAFAALAFLPQGEKYSIAFELSATHIPHGVSRAVPFTGGQLVVLENASEAQKQGAIDFWRYLMEPENLDVWVRASYFLPPTRSATQRLRPWYDEDPTRRISLEQLEFAVPRPLVGAYTIWQDYLIEAIDKVLLGRVPPEEALSEAQTRAEAVIVTPAP